MYRSQFLMLLLFLGLALVVTLSCSSNIIKNNAIKSNPRLASLATENSDSILAVNGSTGDIASLAFPRGMIMMFNGTVIPDGWAICDGNNGTPNLIGRFVLGASASGGVGGISFASGKVNITLNTGQLPSHSHTLSSNGEHTHFVLDNGPNGIANRRSNSGSDNGTSWGTGSDFQSTNQISTYPNGTHSHTVGSTGSGNAIDITPPYFTLIYIMKL